MAFWCWPLLIVMSLNPVMAQVKMHEKIYSEKKPLSLKLDSGQTVTLAPHSQIKVSGKTTVDFIQGRILIESSSDFKVQTDGVSFTTEKGTFEVSQTTSKDIDLDVISGEVEVSSPHVHTFVPEIVKASEGFRYTTKEPGFARRPFSPKINKLVK